jgi:hypothetical protein
MRIFDEIKERRLLSRRIGEFSGREAAAPCLLLWPPLSPAADQLIGHDRIHQNVVRFGGDRFEQLK